MADFGLHTAWIRQAQWSDTANQLKSSYAYWRRVVFGLAIIAAVAAALSVEVQATAISRTLALLAAVCAGLSPIVSAHKVSKEQLEFWTRARSVSEELKAGIFRYLTSSNPERLKLLNDSQEEVLASVRDLVPLSQPEDLPKRARIEDMSVGDYIAERLLGQAQGFYFPKALGNSEVARRLHRAYFGLMLIAAGIAAANGITAAQWTGNWTAVFTTLGASVLAYNSAGRYEYLALSYQATGDQLINLRNRWEELPDSAREDAKVVTQFVDECEAVISNQNQSWHAKIKATDQAAT